MTAISSYDYLVLSGITSVEQATLEMFTVSSASGTVSGHRMLPKLEDVVNLERFWRYSTRRL